MIEPVLDYIDENLDDSIEDLKALCRIPSVAAKGDHMVEAAQLVMRLLESADVDASLHRTSGAPVITGEINVGADKTLMFYDHYDVQPAEPFELWDSDPFEPEIRDGRLYARGVADNKGDTVSRISAIKAFIETDTKLPVNIKFVIEGEEEIGSEHLPEFINANKHFIKADGGIWEFGGSGIDGKQEAWLGLKGILFVQLEVELLSHDSHSSNACVLPSAPYRLVWALGTFKDKTDRILIDGFYDDVRPLSAEEKEAIYKIDFHEGRVRKFFGIDSFLNSLSGDELKEHYYNSPTCNICGIGSGYLGAGSKTVLPAKAFAKLDFRLVEDMNPDDILKKVRGHLDKHGFSDVKIAWHEGYPAAKTPVNHPFVEVVDRANQRVFGHPLVIHPTSPGSGPLYLFKGHVPMVSIGVGDFYSRVHSPNESILIDNFHRSMKRIAVLIEEMSNY